MPDPTADIGFITDRAAKKLGEVVQYYKTLPRGHNKNHKGDNGPSGAGPYIGQAQANIQQGSSGNVDFYAGTKGAEIDTGTTVSVYTRWANINEDDWVLFDMVDQGYEAFPTTSSASSNNNAVSCCGNCVPATLTQAPFFQVTFNQFQNCCAGMSFNGPITLIGSGDTWESGPLTCGSNQCAWLLSVGSPFTVLSFTVGSSQQIEYRTPAAQWSSQCSNLMSLWQPTALPGGSSCGPPCTICVIPQQYNNCGLCPNQPGTAVVTIGAATKGNAWMNGTWELSAIPGGTGSSNSCGFAMTGMGGSGVNGQIQAYRQTSGSGSASTREYQVLIGTTDNTGKFNPQWTYTLDNNTLPCDSSIVSVPLVTSGASGVPSTVSLNFTS